MKKRITNIGLLLIPCLVMSQVGVGTSTPEPSSVLDIVSSNRGVLIPRLQLLGTGDMTTVPVSSNDSGLIVYNLEDSGQIPFNVVKDTYYIWNGNVWEGISTLDDARNIIDENNVSKVLFVGRPNVAVTANASSSYTPWNTVDFGNESLDSQNMHNAGTFIIPTSGLYAFSGGVKITRSTNSGANKYFGARIMLNGVQVLASMFGTINGGNGGFMPLYWNAMLNAGDLVQVQYRMRDVEASGTYTLDVESNLSIINNSN